MLDHIDSVEGAPARMSPHDHLCLSGISCRCNRFSGVSRLGPFSRSHHSSRATSIVDVIRPHVSEAVGDENADGQSESQGHSRW